ncbi:hypothetical protein P153DRAFT_370382 [Dothidotthia symphoricarpi CBS 119687]|uniref:SnoaL-like domain-containing protein n=1 Tax=Dothidotthia symphoricarpi CBS 119687 TaxID=1392245 RepID=A0A6A6A0K1_9PLEO|nr:uncharacterized protein P153DRAFT_370382 [Dothidotthia symphoricarpi CBS 119687]KAF2125056.1 hypothetical protein P153DRAFT_370382 [Dothidotthia symphoricarpi CBS 119687]
MSDLQFSPSEIRLATATLAAVMALLPALYFLYPSQKQESTEHVRTFNKFLKSYSTLRPQALTANASRDFKHAVLPASLNLPPRTLQPFQQHAGMIFSLFAAFDMIPQPNRTQEAVHFSKETDTVVAHCKMGGKVNGESEMGRKLIASGITEWWTECVLFVKMSKDGTKILEVREFVNSAKAEELQKRLSGVLSD